MGLDEFIERWSHNDGGAERANYALFLTELCAVLEVPQPNPASSDSSRNDYVFERGVTRRDGSAGRIDLYKKNCFVLEAKQSRQRRLTPQGSLNEKFVEADDDAEGKVARGRRSSTRSWDVLIRVFYAGSRRSLPKNMPSGFIRRSWLPRCGSARRQHP